MDKNFTINGTVYETKDLDFCNLLCDLEDRGVNITDLIHGRSKNQMSFCRAMISVIAGLTIKDAGKLLTKHLASGGELTEMSSIIGELMSEAGFGAAGQTESEPDGESE